LCVGKLLRRHKMGKIRFPIVKQAKKTWKGKEKGGQGDRSSNAVLRDRGREGKGGAESFMRGNQNGFRSIVLGRGGKKEGRGGKRREGETFGDKFCGPRPRGSGKEKKRRIILQPYTGYSPYSPYPRRRGGGKERGV